MTLTEFLLARIAEDEATATACLHEVAMTDDRYSWSSVDFNAQTNENHGLRWNPTRVLAECEAKRRIVDLLSQAENDRERYTDWPVKPLFEGRWSIIEAAARQFTLPYADHPDYDQAWAV